MDIDGKYLKNGKIDRGGVTIEEILMAVLWPNWLEKHSNEVINHVIKGIYVD